MKNFCLLFLLIGGLVWSETYHGVDYAVPAGWKIENMEAALGLRPTEISPDQAAAIVMGASETLSGVPFAGWVEKKLAEETADGTRVLQTSEPHQTQDGEHRSSTVVRVMQDPAGVSTIRMYHAITNGKQAVIAVALMVSEEAANFHTGAIRAFFHSMRIHQDASLPDPSQSTNPITGDWTTSSYFGDIVDSTTGAFDSTAYSGQWYSFRRDGTYRHTFIGGGLVLSGAAISEGTYILESMNVLRLSQKTVSWIPMPGTSSATKRPRYDRKPEPKQILHEIQTQDGTLLIRDDIGSWTKFRRKP